MKNGKPFSPDKYLTAAFLVLFIVIIIIWCLAFTRAYFTNYDAYDYAQMGREIKSGHGFSTKQIFPRHIPFLSQKGYLTSEEIPNLYRYPLPTLSSTIFQILTSDLIRAAIIQSGFWFFLSLLAVFFLAKRFSNSMVAILSVLIFAGDRSIWQHSYGGMTESLSMLLLLLVFLSIYSTRLSRWKWLLAGLLCGAACLTRSQLLPLFPLAIVFSWFSAPKSKRLSALILVVIGFCIVVSPWMIRNFTVADDPFFSFSTSRNLVLGTSFSHSDLEMQLYAPVKTSVVWGEYGKAILGKLFRNVWPEFINPFSWTQSSLYAFFLVLIILASLFLRGVSPDSKHELFKWNVLVLVFVNFIIVSLAFPSKRFYVIFFPLIIILFFQEIFFLLRWAISEQRSKLLYSILGLLMAAGLIWFTFTAMSTQGSPPFAAEERRSYEILSDLADPQSVIASDISHKITLYNGNRTIRLPYRTEELLEISHAFFPIDYVVFSESIIHAFPSNGSHLFETYENYRSFRESKDFLEEFELVMKLPNGAEVYQKVRSP
jgi:4-amino-4-deoxy-L-arabinose transferase-like glycosyltransferase